MSEDILEWRRQWTPDLGALPWNRFTIDGTTILLKSYFTRTSYSVLVYDFSSVWQEVGEARDVERKAKKCNPNVEAPLSRLLQHLEELLQGEQKSAKYYLSYKGGEQGEENGPSLSIKLTSKLAQGVPFCWTLDLSRASDEVASTHLTIPLLTMVSELMRRERELEKIIKKKDEEIEDYKMSGAKVSRKHKLTQAYDATAFNHDMIQSKAFKSEVESSGQRAFNGPGQDLYREVMVTTAWLNRPIEADDDGNEDDAEDDGEPSLQDPGPTGPSWATRLPRSLIGDIPSMADTLSPVKSSPSKSPSKSPMKASPAAAAQETELMRREALEKRLLEEKAKQQTKKKKKKLF